KLTRFGGHWSIIEDCQVAEMCPVCVNERHAQVAFDAALRAQLIRGEPLAYALRVVTEGAANHIFTGRPGHVPFEVCTDPVAGPERQGTSFRSADENGHERIGRTDNGCQVPDQGAKKLLSGVACGSFDDGAQCV